MVPNLTTSGTGVDGPWAEKSAVFGQVNVSFDGYSGPRPAEVYRRAAEAAKTLKRHRSGVGINCVLTRGNFGKLDEVCALAHDLGLKEVELLRFKPSGRAAGGGLFGEMDLTPDMYAALVRTVERLMIRHRTRIKLDCSLVPAVASAGVSKTLMEIFGVSGCEGGNELCAIDARGAVRGCSFARNTECGAGTLESRWNMESAFREFRAWEEKGARVCLDCRYFDICRGGCHVVSEHVNGDWYAPDPSCAIAARAVTG
jgi:radical SAM protein with 4Fe4S-binding SPASM domain